MLPKDIDKQDYFIGVLTELANEFKKVDLPLIVGGGFCQYIRSVYFTIPTSPRYKFRVIQRTTKDIDMFLTSDVIASGEKVRLIKGILDKLNYKVVTPYFQYQKKVKFSDASKYIGLDVLTEPPKETDADKVKKSKPPRVRPLEVEKFHAFMHKEAAGLKENWISVPEYVDEKYRDIFNNIYIPSAMHYLIMKLFALRDRYDDSGKDYGRHHAFDIFATITQMNERDWENFKSKVSCYDNEIINESKIIVEEYFSDADAKGVIRIKENELYQRNKKLYDDYIPDFLSDLKTLFSIS